MSEDDFSELANSALKQVAAGAADVIDDAFDTVAGPLLGATFSVFEALGEKNNKALAAFRLSAVENEIIELRNELRRLKAVLAREGKEPDRADVLTQAAVASEFVRDISEARTVGKREAIVHATAYQFDPRKGSPEARDYWLRRVSEAPDAEHALVRLLVQHGEVTFFDNAAYATTDVNNIQSPATTTLAIGRADVVVLETVAQQVAAAGAGQLVYIRAHRRVVPPAIAKSTTALQSASSAPAYALTAVGEEFVKFISAG